MKTLSMNYGAFGATLALVINALFALQVHAANPAWVYYPSENVISNDDAVGQSKGYVLNVAVVDANAHTLQLGNGSRGDAFKTFGGTTLDLSERIEDADGTQWTITKFGGDALRATDEIGAKLPTIVVLPKELTSAPGQHFNNRPEGAKIKSITMDCPEWAGEISAYFLPDAESAVVKLPKITKLNPGSLGAAGDAKDWDLSGVLEVADGAFNWKYQHGTLNLPNVRKMGYVGTSMHHDRVALGTASCSLEEVSSGAFVRDPGNVYYYVKEFVIGGAEGWKVGSGAFAVDLLERVYMVGAVPTFTNSAVAFGLTNAAAKTMAFYVPTNVAAWAEIAKAATPLTDAEIEAFKTAHPTWDVPFAVVSSNVFQTANDQYLGAIANRYKAFGTKVPVSISNRAAGQYEGDVVTIKVDGEDWTGDASMLPIDSEITVTATTTDANTKISWEGTLPDGTTPTGSSFTFTPTEANAIALNVRFTHAWKYDAEAQTISDGYWTLVVKKTADRELQLGAGKDDRSDGRTGEPWALPVNYESKGLAELDLTGSIYKVGEVDEVWTITSILDQAFKNANGFISSFYAPTTLKSMGMQVFNGVWSGLENVVFECPEMTGAFGIWGYEFNSAPIKRLVLSLPKIESIGHGAPSCFGSMTLTDTDLATWDLTGLKEVNESGLKVNGSGPGPDGELVLPNIETLGAMAFINWTRLSSAVLGTNGTLKTVGAYLFGNNTGLKKLDFGESCDFTVNTNAFMSTDSTPLALEEVYFTGTTPPSVETLDALVKGREVGEDGSKPVVIYAPMQKSEWQALKGEMTAGEQTQALALRKKGVRVEGVYVTQDGRRVVWLAMHPTCHYSGLILILR
jgi:hypothetical protein